MHMQRF